MAQAKVATWRITGSYNVSGLLHKARMFVKSDGSISSGVNQIQDRTGTSLDWSLAAHQWSKTWTRILNNATTLPDLVLEQKVGLIWVPVQFTSPSNELQADATLPTTQVTLTLRATNNDKLKVVVLDTTQAAPQHFAGRPSASSNIQVFTDHFLSGGNAADPYMVMVSESNHYLNTAPFVGLTITLNRRVRRARGLT